jgi:hypothetical protein
MCPILSRRAVTTCNGLAPPARRADPRERRPMTTAAQNSLSHSRRAAARVCVSVRIQNLPKPRPAPLAVPGLLSFGRSTRALETSRTAGCGIKSAGRGVKVTGCGIKTVLMSRPELLMGHPVLLMSHLVLISNRLVVFTPHPGLIEARPALTEARPVLLGLVLT